MGLDTYWQVCDNHVRFWTFTASELCSAQTQTIIKNLLTWVFFWHSVKIFCFFYCSLLKFTHGCKKWLTFYIVSWYTHQTIEYRKSFFRYFSSILKAFRVIGAVLEQIESLHKTEPETSRDGRAFPVCLCSDFLVPLPVCTLRTERPSVWNTRPWPPPRTTRGSEPDNAAGRGQEAHAGRTANPPGCYSFVGVGFLPTPR